MFAALLGGCGHSGGGHTSQGAVLEIPAFVVQITTDRTSGIPGTVFHLHASTLASKHPVTSWSWNDGNGNASEGVDTSAVYSQAGTYIVTLSARDENEASVDVALPLTVFDLAHPETPLGTPLPPLLGDVDGNGQIALEDAHLLAKQISELDLLDPATALDAGDLDLDGSLTQQDVALIAEAVMNGAALPDLLVPAHGMPGTVVTLISPRLMAPAAVAQVRIGAHEPTLLTRSVLGRTSFVIPLDPQTLESYAVSPGPLAIELIIDGALAHTYVFSLDAPPVLPANPREELKHAFQLAAQARAQMRTAYPAYLGTSYVAAAGATDTERAVASTLFTESLDELDTCDDLLGQALDLLHPDIVAAWYRVAWANGLPQATEELEEVLAGLHSPASLASLAASPEEDLERLCEIQGLVEAWGHVDTALSLACTGLLAAGVTAFFVPAAGTVASAATLFAAAQVCAGAYGPVAILSILSELIPAPADHLKLLVTPEEPLLEGESAEIRAVLPILGYSQLCGLAAGQTAEALLGRIAEKAAKKMLTTGPIGSILGPALHAFPIVFADLVEHVSDLLEGLLGTLPVFEPLQSLAANLCGYLESTNTIPLDGHDIFLPPVPAIGSLLLPIPGSGEPAVYTYFENPDISAPPEGILVRAQKEICGTTVEGEAHILVAGDEVTITMGDNGPALDDIFEVVVDGVSVLTSSVPVVSVQTTMELSGGDHELEMHGLAAPDGIGTYFISVSGGQLLNGPPQSGTNLTAGTVFTWTLRVGTSP